jgi:hypothetical protein
MIQQMTFLLSVSGNDTELIKKNKLSGNDKSFFEIESD